jgi:hypothetical protein
MIRIGTGTESLSAYDIGARQLGLGVIWGEFATAGTSSSTFLPISDAV